MRDDGSDVEGWLTGVLGGDVTARVVPGVPHQGFERLWQQGYRADLGDAFGPQELLADWRENFENSFGRALRDEVDYDTVSRSLVSVIDQTLAPTVIQIRIPETPRS